MTIPPRTIALALIATIGLVGSFIWFGIEHKDISQLVIYVAVTMGIYYAAYDQWHKATKTMENEKRIEELEVRLDQEISDMNLAIDKMDNYFQNKINKKEENKDANN